MEKQNVIQLVRKPTLSTRLKQASVIAFGTALAAHASAASSIDAVGLTEEIDGAKATVITLFAAGLVLLGIFAGWRYLKRGANSA
ncbi:major capsid protein [Acinetobacter johnsonii]|uniref:major capsid protein n=1 Tax=Acinetobacter johnsonii TaxID=40214 RepID=UPI00294ABE45|nr:major capsid protein [Acinetobacter johnsonii]